MPNFIESLMSQIIKDAIYKAGGAVQVASKFGISRISVYEWISKSRLPAERVIPLAQLTDWTFTPHMLDPVIYPNPDDGMPASPTAP